MINFTDTLKYGKNPFYSVSKSTSNQRYWQNVDADNQDLTVAEIIDMPIEKARKTKNYKALGVAIGATTLFIAGSIFFFLKGGPKSLSKGFKSISEYLEKKLSQSKIDFESNPLMLSYYEFLKRKADYFSKKSEIINNYTTIKDYSIKFLVCGKNEKSLGAKIHNGITEIFRKIASNTVITSYKDSLYAFYQTSLEAQRANGSILDGDLSQIIEISGKKLTRRQWLDILVSKNKELISTYKHHFSVKNVNSRFNLLSKATKEVEQEFNRKGIFWFLSKDTISSFVADNILLKRKLQIQKEVNGYRKTISYSKQDLVCDIKKKIFEITKLISYKDTEKLKHLKELQINIEHLLKDNPAIRDKMILKFDKAVNALETAVLKSENIDNNTAKELLKHISELKVYKNYTPGKVEDILAIYKALLPISRYKELEKHYQTTVLSLDNSIKLETEDYISKLRDLTLGSAPTDVLTMISGIGTLGYFIAKADDKKEIASVSLKYGIPALVGIATGLYGNAKLFAGSKSMIFGTISMFLTNRIGAFAHDKLIQYWNKNDKIKNQK